MVMHSTLKHHGMPATTRTDGTQGTPGTSALLPEVTVFCLFTPDKLGMYVPDNGVQRETYDPPTIPAGVTTFDPCTLPAYTTTLMLGPHIGVATLGLVSPEHTEQVLAHGADNAGNEDLPPVVCPYHPVGSHARPSPRPFSS